VTDQLNFLVGCSIAFDASLLATESLNMFEYATNRQENHLEDSAPKQFVIPVCQGF
jgi:hypothetical protein